MKIKFLSLVAILLGISLGTSSQTLPQFSTIDDPIWYYVQFTTGSCTLIDNGAGIKLKTATKASTDAQKWQFIGDENSFVMRSKLGNYVGFENSFFKTTLAEDSIQTLSLKVNGQNFEIGRSTTTNRMNQWSGARAGVFIGEYYAGDVNNILNFVAASPLPPTFSPSVEDSDDDVWYYIQFVNSSNTVASAGVDNFCLQAKIKRDDAQLWKLVGTKTNFQLINKLGGYASVNGKLMVSDQPYTAGFAIEPTSNTNTNYEAAWEIKNNASANYLNQWSGTTVGYYLGFWSKGDNNNPLKFVEMDQVKYTEYDITGVDSFTPDKPLTLWYNKPAVLTNVSNTWMEYSLPIGNGQLGASLYGNVLYDEIQFNEKTLWTGGPNDIASSSAYGQYKNFGSIIASDKCSDLGFTSAEGVKNYVRYLDIERAVAGVKFSNCDNSTQYERTYISSYPDQVIAVHYVATGSNKLTMTFTATPGEGINASDVTYADGYGSYGGKLTTVTYSAQFKVVPIGDNASMTTNSKGINVYNADEILLVLAAGTDFDATTDSRISATDQLTNNILARIDAAAAKGWCAIFNDHVADFTSYMGRVSLQLADAASSLPTDELVKNYNNTAANVTGTEPEVLFLEQLYFAYGRYLEISSSRGVDVPSNLQGIWNNLSYAPWNGDIHSNINVQMNYWPAEPTNLSEMHMPFLNYIIQNAKSANWKRAATTYGGVTDGWTCFTENNIFGGMSNWGTNYFVANAWYCAHLWQHYGYTLDKDFLARAFPAMWSCAQFWMERMIKDRKVGDGTYVCPNEYSPEQNNNSSEDATAHSQQLVSYLLDSVKQSVEILGQEACDLSDDDIVKLNDYIDNIDRGLHTEEFKGGTWEEWGTSNGISAGDLLLREWKYSDYDVSTDKGHRHMSHLMALFPLDQINSSSEFFTPAVNSLKLRGDAATGWSMGWKVNLWARAHDGDHAHVILKNALKHSTSYSTNQYAGGIYYNLYDSHAPFQIDGNFGVCSGVAEMLMQSHSGTIDLLPALPSVWQKGEIKGLKAMGDFTVDIAWDNNQVTTATIVSNQGQPLAVSGKDIAHCHIYLNGVEISETATPSDDSNNGDDNNGDNGESGEVTDPQQPSDGDDSDIAQPTVKTLLPKVKINGDGTSTMIIQTAAGDVVSFAYDASYTNLIDEVGTSNVDRIEAPDDNLSIYAYQRTISIVGKDITAVKVYNLQGSQVLSTKSVGFTVPDSAGNVVIVVAIDRDGNAIARKLFLR
jgi:alpha-L-fucosidase 2